MSEAVDRQIARLAGRQSGYVTRVQLLALGIPVHAIEYRLKIGRLIAVYAGVYAVGHVPASPVDRAAGAILACGPRALLSHSSAAALWGIRKDWSLPFEVSVPGERRPANIKVHRRVVLTRADRRIHLGIRVTSPARTILDNARRLDDGQLTRAVDTLRLSGFLHLGQLAEAVIRCPRHPGAACVRPLLVQPTAPTRSELEIVFKTLIKTYRLPQPLINVMFNGYLVDALFVRERVIVELDGWEVHKTQAAFEGDRDRDAENLKAGYVTVRVTWKRMTGSPAREAARLEKILRARR
jgi:very-short-patch-repair endonuclease